MRKLVLGLVLGLACGGISAAAERTGVTAFAAVGSVQTAVSSGGQATIVRSPQLDQPIDASPGEFLYPGDKIYVRGQGAQLEILLRGRPEPAFVREGSSPFEVKAGEPLSIPERVRGFLASISWPRITPAQIKRGKTFGRGAGAEPLPGEPLRLSPSMASPDITIPRDLTHLTIAWCGDAAYAEAYGPKASGRVDPLREEGALYATVQAPAMPSLKTVTVQDLRSAGGLTFNVQRVDRSALPRPDWLGSSSPRDPAERVAWSIWLLREAKPEFHAFALTQLVDARSEMIAAREYLLFATTCPAPAA